MKKGRLFSRLVTAFLAMSLVFALGCGSSDKQETEKTSIEETKKVLKVGTEATFAPFEYKDESGKVTGFDAEIMQAIADEMGVTLELNNLAWDGHDSALNAGSVDAIISAVTITDERKKEVDFSEQYFEAWQTIAIKEGSNVNTIEALAGQKVGVQANTTGQTTAEGIKGITEIKKFKTAPDALMELRNGGVAAVIADYPVVSNYIKNNAEAKLVTVNANFEKEYYGIKMKKGNTELVKQVNEALAKIKSNGKYDQIFEKYFGKKPESK